MLTAKTLFRHKRYILKTFAISSSSQFFNFCTLNTSEVPLETKIHDYEEEKPIINNNNNNNTLSWRVERLSNREPVVSAFQSWMGDGFPIHRGDIFHAINRLRKLKLNKRALEIMEWVIRERPYKPKELDFSYLLEFTIKLHGVSFGETLFKRIPKEFQNDLLYNNLVIACLDQGRIRLSLAYMKKMRELSFPISYLVFNRLISLHSSPGRKKAIPKILAQMKADGVAPHVSTYNILLKIEADAHSIEGLNKVLGEMKRAEVEPNEITYCILATAHAVARLYSVTEAYVEEVEKSKTGNNWSTLDVLLILYGYLGKERELEQTWRAVHQLPYVRYKSFVLAIEAYGRLERLDRAEELWHGLIDKATEVFKEMEEIGSKPNAITYRHLSLGCLKAGMVEEALKTLEVGLGQTITSNVKRSTPWLETTLLIVEMLADRGDLENAKRLFVDLKEARYTRYTFVYNTLIKAHVKAKVYDQDLLKKMILGGARPDAETYSLMKLSEQFKTSLDTIKRAHAFHPITALQIEYSLWTRNIEGKTIPLCRQLGIAISCVRHPRFEGTKIDKNKLLYTSVSDLAAKHNCTPPQLALAWILHQGEDVVPIPVQYGFFKGKMWYQYQNLDNNIDSLKLKFSEEDMKKISEASLVDEVAGMRTYEHVNLLSWKFANTTSVDSNFHSSSGGQGSPKKYLFCGVNV
ncbi:Pentatricopeptide repeat-containing protein [Thalictrum thalictroides]|uniref:Pentatricopeptide repeat-containing protein n=1 Tax=Thalictrum thalictroides TaxID=46969 RepID=A0A7J6X934_THATH|nr:Pentatricopeptide repeat-containing protein [Thalictrum thalictroides]